MIATAGGTTTNHVKRTWGDFPDNTGSWTYLLYFNITSLPTGYFNLMTLFDGAADLTAPYLYLGAGVGATDVVIEYFNGTTTTDSTAFTASINTLYWAAVTYNSATTTLTLIVDGTTIGTLLATDLSDHIWDSIYYLGDGSGNTPQDCAVGYSRAWDRVLNSAELTAEAASTVAVSMTGLIWDNPLQGSIDLTAHNNTLNQLIAVGTVTTNTTDPLVSIVAGPPTNTTPGTATDITLDSIVFQTINTAGTATDVWYKYQVTADDDVLSILGFGDLTTYKPHIQVYDSLANANLDIEYEVGGISIESPSNRGVQFPLPSGLPVFYFLVKRNGAVAGSTLQLSLLRALDLEVPDGSLAINQDNSQGWPLVIMDKDTGYPIHFILDWPGGNGGCTLENGKTIFGVGTTGVFKVFDITFSLVATVDVGVTSEFASSNLVDNFIVVSRTDPPIARIISEDGVLDPVSYTLSTGGGCEALALSRDSTIIYYVRGAANEPVRRWNVTTNTTMSNLAGGVAGYSACKNEIVVLDDDSIVVNYYRTSPSNDVKIINYSAAGAILHTYDFGPFTTFAGAENRIAGAVDNLNQFWSWIKFVDAHSTGQFRRVKVSDGSILTFFTTEEYDFGQYQGTETNTPKRFGNPDSCPFLVVRVSIFPPSEPGGGIYSLTGTNVTNPRIDHDEQWVDATVGSTTSVAINNPFAETYLAGDE